MDVVTRGSALCRVAASSRGLSTWVRRADFWTFRRSCPRLCDGRTASLRNAICWLGANPLWLVGLIALARGKTIWALVSGLLAALLAFLTLMIGAFPPDSFELAHFHAGYYVWLTSMVALPVCAAVVRGFENATWNHAVK